MNESDSVSVDREPADRTRPTGAGVGDENSSGDDRDLWAEDWSDLDRDRNEPGDEHTRQARRRPTAGDGVEMFQNAMLELIAAARTALDTAEELVADPNAIGTAIESIRGLAADAFRGGLDSARSAVDPEEGDDDDEDFQSIRVDDA